MKKIQINYNNSVHVVSYANDFIANHVERDGAFFEHKLLDLLKNKVTDFNVVVDIGANVGNHSYFFKNICNAGLIHAFEPIQSNYIICKENIPADAVYNVALSNYIGSTTMHNSMGFNSGTSKMTSTEGDIEVRTLDSFNLDAVTFMKIDVEGAELTVLEGAAETIDLYSPEILIEIHDHITIEDVMEKLPIGYTFECLSSEHYFLKRES